MMIYVRKILATVCAIWVSMAGTLTAFATEQGTEPLERGASGFMLTMDVLQKVCLVIVIIVAVAVLAFYAVKLVLKKLYVPPRESSEPSSISEKGEDDDHDQK